MKDVRDPRDELIDHLGALGVMARGLTDNKHRADDLVQDTIAKAWDKIETFAPGTNMRAWLYTILRNTLYSDRRKSGREVSDRNERFTNQLSEKPTHDGRLLLRNFCHVFCQLNIEQREALLLVGAQGFTYEETAEICGVSVGTVKSRVCRGRKILSERLYLEAEASIVETDNVIIAVTSTRLRIW